MSRHGPYHVAHHSTRNPWSAGHCSESVSSSASSQTYHIIPPNHYVQVDPCWEGGGQYHLLGGRYPQDPVQPSGLPTAVTPTGVYLLPQTVAPSQRNHYYNQPSDSTGRRSRPISFRAITPVSAGGVGSSETAVLPCGGHCIPLETFCHSFLQVVFVFGILVGFGMIVAGKVFVGERPDLGVLVYIGAILGLVSALLISIQTCSKPRPRQRRYRHQQPQMREEIPLQPMMIFHHHQPQPQNHHNYRDEGGIPWWRREDAVP